MSDNESSKSVSQLIWVLAIFFGWITSLIFFFMEKGNEETRKEAKIALNLSINLILLTFALSIIISILSFILPNALMLIIGIAYFLFFSFILIYWIIICIKHYKAIAYNTDKPRIPFVITFLK